MDDDDFGDPTRFEWTIYNPFYSWRTIEAAFLTKYSSHRMWRFKLSPCHLNALPLNALKLSLVVDPVSLSLSFMTRLKIEVSENDQFVSVQKFFRHFSITNDFTFLCWLEAGQHITVGTQKLTIVITALPYREYRKVGCPFRLWGRQMDLDKLSDDLTQMCLSGDGNMTISSTTGRGFRVHPCIVKTRWTNLFQIHDLKDKEVDGFTLSTEISTSVLRNLLLFMYSGRVSEHWRLSDDSAYTIELFQVISRYYLHHLYRLFVSSPLRHRRETFIHSHSLSFSINLEFSHSEACTYIHAVPISYELNNKAYSVNMGIFIASYGRAGLWLAYDLLSKSPQDITFQVITELDGCQTTQILHINEYSMSQIKRSVLLQSGPVLFLGSTGPFQGCVNKERIRLRFRLKFTDFGSNFTQYSEDTLAADDATALMSLCEHMWITLFDKFKADTKIVSAVEGNRTFVVHKSILMARMPKWVNLAFTIEDGFYVVKLPLHTEAIDFLLKYVYTGKVDHFPRDLLREIYDFSDKMEFRYLAMQLQTVPAETQYHWFME